MCPPQYTSRGSVRHQTPDLRRPFLTVCSASGSTHTTSAPKFPQSNGKADWAVRKKLYTTVPVVSSSLNPGWMSISKKRERERKTRRKKNRERGLTAEKELAILPCFDHRHEREANCINQGQYTVIWPSIPHGAPVVQPQSSRHLDARQYLQPFNSCSAKGHQSLFGFWYTTFYTSKLSTYWEIVAKERDSQGTLRTLI